MDKIKEKEIITPQSLSDSLARSGLNKIIKTLELPPSNELPANGAVPTPEEAEELLKKYQKKLKV